MNQEKRDESVCKRCHKNKFCAIPKNAPSIETRVIGTIEQKKYITADIQELKGRTYICQNFRYTTSKNQNAS